MALLIVNLQLYYSHCCVALLLKITKLQPLKKNLRYSVTY